MSQLEKGTPEYERALENLRSWIEALMEGGPATAALEALMKSKGNLGTDHPPLPTAASGQREYWQECIAESARARVRIEEEYAEDSRTSPEASERYAALVILNTFQRMIVQAMIQKLGDDY